MWLRYASLIVLTTGKGIRLWLRSAWVRFRAERPKNASVDLYTWEKIQKEENIPKYLADLEIEDEIGRQLRSGAVIPLKSHTVPMPELQDESNEVEFLEEILEDSGLN